MSSVFGADGPCGEISGAINWFGKECQIRQGWGYITREVLDEISRTGQILLIPHEFGQN